MKINNFNLEVKRCTKEFPWFYSFLCFNICFRGLLKTSTYYIKSLFRHSYQKPAQCLLGFRPIRTYNGHSSLPVPCISRFALFLQNNLIAWKGRPRCLYLKTKRALNSLLLCILLLSCFSGSVPAYNYIADYISVNIYIALEHLWCLVAIPLRSAAHDDILGKLSGVMRAAARLILVLPRKSHVTSEIRTRLHWLDMPSRVQFKLCCLAFRCLHGSAPPYLAGYFTPVSSIEGRSQLRSAAAGLLLVPRTWTVRGFLSCRVEQSPGRSSWP